MRETDTSTAGAAIPPTTEANVQPVLLKNIDLNARTYTFRAALRTGRLAESIKANGILVPVVLWPRHQIISGFRRIQAARAAGRSEVPALDLPRQRYQLRAGRDTVAAGADSRGGVDEGGEAGAAGG